MYPGLVLHLLSITFRKNVTHFLSITSHNFFLIWQGIKAYLVASWEPWCMLFFIDMQHQGWFTPGNPELSAWRRSISMSTISLLVVPDLKKVHFVRQITLGVNHSWQHVYVILCYISYYQCMNPSIIVWQHDQGASWFLFLSKGHDNIKSDTYKEGLLIFSTLPILKGTIMFPQTHTANSYAILRALSDYEIMNFIQCIGPDILKVMTFD